MTKILLRYVRDQIHPYFLKSSGLILFNIFVFKVKYPPLCLLLAFRNIT